MAAYVIVEIAISDPEVYAEYRQLVPPTVVAYAGAFLGRGGRSKSLEGDWAPQRIVVIQFPTLERAKAWWSSPEYSQAKVLRQRSAHTRMLVVEGV